jgi:hypothetical protein
MKKTTIFLGMIFLLSSFVLSDTNIGVGLTTPEDIHGDFYLNAGGDIYLNIDGLSYYEENQRLDELARSSHRPMSSIFNQFSDVFIERDGRTGEYYFTPYDDLQPYEQKFRWTMTQYILSTTENQLSSKFDDYDFWLEMFKGQFTEEELCRMMIDTAIRLKMDEIRCGNVLYNIDSQGNVFVMQSYLPKELKEEQKSQAEKLCEKGMKAFCSGYEDDSYQKLICPDGQWVDGKCLRFD